MIQQQGSNRVYSRVTDEQGRSLIRVEGTNRDENRAFIYMARHFHKLGLPVPELYTVSDDEMTYTQEDLGDTLLFDAIKHGRETGNFNETERTLLERTLRALAHIQVEGAKDFDWSICFPVPEMDERAIRWDLNYFKYCFLKGTKIEFSEPALENDFDRLVFNLTAERSVNCQLSTVNCQLSTFLYRDFQSRNVMIKDGKPYFIDFQGVGNGLQEMGFAFKISSVAVRAEDLQRAQEDEMRECGAPFRFSHAWLKLLEFVQIGVYQFFAERSRDIRFCLPEEGGYVILRRTFASALKINKIRLAVFDHHIAALEIAV